MVVWSALAHAGALGLVLASPGVSDHAPPRVISVELVAPSLAAAPAAQKPAPAPAPVAPPEPAPPPPPKPKQVVLPEKPQAPKPETKPKPREAEVFKEPEKKQEKSLEELIAEMRGNAAETPPAPAPAPAEPALSAIAPSPGLSSGRGDPLSAEERDWQARVIRQMKGIWVVPPGFRTQPLQTRVVVTLDAAGNILGKPRVTQRSGNPWYDDGVVRGLNKASPLPPPPEAGDWVMWF